MRFADASGDVIWCSLILYLHTEIVTADKGGGVGGKGESRYWKTTQEIIIKLG